MSFAPTNRLVLFALVLCPAALLAPISSVAASFCLLLYVGLFALAAMDWFASKNLLGGLSAEPAPVSRLSLGNSGKIELFFRCDGAEPSKVVVGLVLDELLGSDIDELAVDLSRESKIWTVHWPLNPRRRGVYPLQATYVQTDSRFGLWRFKKRYPCKAEARVYPNLRRDRRQLANIFLNRGMVGTHLQRIIGQGRDYEQLREYLPGDSMFDIHWKATAKRGEPVTKTYQVERTREIYLILDHSRLSGRIVASGQDGAPDESALERFLTATSILNLVAGKQGDLFGLVTFADKVTGFMRASSGRAHQQCVQDSLFNLHTSRTTPDFDELFTFLRLRLRHRALLVFLTDLSDPAASEAFTSRVRMISRQHVILTNMIVGGGIGPLFRPDQEINSLDEMYSALSGHLRWHDLAVIGRSLRQSGVSLGLLEQENLAVEVVNQYLRIKQRQLI
ncbi:MAG: DUF58 domain-containing protein [Verrucomicrobiota bacterium]